jgi:hypothetical protein
VGADSCSVKQSDAMVMSPLQFVTPIANRAGVRGSPSMPMSLPTSAAVRAACEALEDPFDLPGDALYGGSPFPLCPFEISMDGTFPPATPGLRTKLHDQYGVITPVTGYPPTAHGPKRGLNGRRDASGGRRGGDKDRTPGVIGDGPKVLATRIPRATQEHLSVWDNGSSSKSTRRRKAGKNNKALQPSIQKASKQIGRAQRSKVETPCGPSATAPSTRAGGQGRRPAKESAGDENRATPLRSEARCGIRQPTTEGCLERNWQTRTHGEGCIQAETLDIVFPRAPRIFRFRLGSGQSMQAANAALDK